MSKVLAFSLIAAGCVTAAAGGAYVAVRHSAAPAVVEMAAVPAGPSEVAAQQPAAQPVSETEALVDRPAVQPAPVAPIEPRPVAAERPQVQRAARAAETRSRARAADSGRTGGAAAGNGRQAEPVAGDSSHAQPPSADRVAGDVSTPPAVPAVETTPEPQDPPPSPLPEFEEVVIPSGAVIGLQVTTPLSSERTQVEDRVEARVTRDVAAGGRVAIPAGSRAIGAVTVVERGGKMKERARLGVRFHTLVLANGVELPLRTDAIYREGQSPAGESARKIGGAAVGGAILGAILGGGKGAAIGGATGAAGGTAVVMAGDRNAAVLSAGETVTVRLTSPVSVEVRKDK